MHFYNNNNWYRKHLTRDRCKIITIGTIKNKQFYNRTCIFDYNIILKSSGSIIDVILYSIVTWTRFECLSYLHLFENLCLILGIEVEMNIRRHRKLIDLYELNAQRIRKLFLLCTQFFEIWKKSNFCAAFSPYDPLLLFEGSYIIFIVIYLST